AEWVVTRRANLWGGLPPAVLAADDIRLECVVQPRPRPHAALGRFNARPVARPDTTLGRRRRMQLHLRLHSLPAQAGQVTVLAFAKQAIFGAGQDQRVAFDQLWP